MEKTFENFENFWEAVEEDLVGDAVEDLGVAAVEVVAAVEDLGVAVEDDGERNKFVVNGTGNENSFGKNSLGMETRRRRRGKK